MTNTDQEMRLRASVQSLVNASLNVDAWESEALVDGLLASDNEEQVLDHLLENASGSMRHLQDLARDVAEVRGL